MSADFNNPTVDDQYTEILPQIRNNQSANAVMFNGVSVSNIPVNAVQFVSGQFNLWNGAAWNVQPVSIAGGGTGGMTASEARANLGVNSTAESNSAYLKVTSNGSDINDISIFRTEIDVYGKSEMPEASTTVKGIVEAATSGEMSSGTSDKYPDASTIKGYYGESNSLTLSAPSGDFTTGSCKIARTGDIVVISGLLNHPLNSTPSSAAGFIPSWGQPTQDVTNVYILSQTGSKLLVMLTVDSSGILQMKYVDGSFDLVNFSGSNFTISYTV